MGERLSPAEVRALVVATLRRCRTGESQAGSVAEALLGAELAGQPGHGLRRLPAYAAQALEGKVDGHAEPVAHRTRPGALAVDAAHGFAYPALDLACAALPEMARTQGLAMAGIARSHHAGVTGLPAERLAQAGVVALVLANSPPAIAPWGAGRALYGTNPIAFAAPVPGEEPVVVDLSVSRVARGRVMAAAQRDEPIPPGWALDAAGQPTTDARAALAGTMIPMGEAKGAALALMVELLAAGITGGRFAWEASSFLAPGGGPPGTGQLLLAIDPGAFGVDGAARIGRMAAEIAGEPGARLPGRRRQALRARLAAEGIALDPALAAEIAAVGA